MMWDYGGGWGAWMFLVSIVFVVAVIMAIVFLVRGMTTGGQTPHSSSPEGPSAKEILKQRYTAGEIDREEFQQRLRDLES